MPRGHAIECRIYAEDPDNNFLPSPGRIQKLRVPHGPGVRDDSGATEGLDVPIFYDPLISKLITWGDDRTQALARMRRALREYEVHGIKTTLPFFRWALDDPDFLAGRFDTTFIDRTLAARAGAPFDTASPDDETLAAIAAAMHQVLAGPTQARAGVARAASVAPSRWRAQARAEALR